MPGRELTARICLLVAAGAAAAIGSSTFLTAPLGAASLLATSDLLVPVARRGDLTKRVLYGFGLGLVSLVLLGLVLDFTGIGLTVKSWAVGFGMFSAVVLFARRTTVRRTGSVQPADSPWPGLDKFAARWPVLWIGAAGVVLVAALVVEEAGAVTVEAPLALSAQTSASGVESVVVSGGAVGAYVLDIDTTNRRRLLALVSTGPGLKRTVPIPRQDRSVTSHVVLVDASTDRVVRYLILVPGFGG